MAALMQEILGFIVACVSDFGYLGIFLLMALESSFIPFPSEAVMIPAGYLVFKGEMNALAVLGAGCGGSVAGALVNYYIAYYLGNAIIYRYGKYFLMPPKSYDKVLAFFKRHGAISTFIGRLVPGVRQYISFPAGLCHLSLGRFILYTALGAGIWTLILVIIGYYIGYILTTTSFEGLASIVIGHKSPYLNSIMHYALGGTLALCIVVLGIYIVMQKRASKRGQVASEDTTTDTAIDSTINTPHSASAMGNVQDTKLDASKDSHKDATP